MILLQAYFSPISFYALVGPDASATVVKVAARLPQKQESWGLKLENEAKSLRHIPGAAQLVRIFTKTHVASKLTEMGKI